MNPSTGQPDSEKGLGAGSEALALAPPPTPSPRGYRFTVYMPPLDYITQGRPRNARRRRRCWQYFACGFFALFALHFLLSQPRFRWRPRRDRIWTSGPLQCADKVNWNTTHVDSQNDFPLHARASITLPLTAEELYFIAEGALSFGAFDVVQTPDVGPDNALVDVEVSFHSHEALLDATVCRLHPSDAKWGFGIFTPRWQRPRHERMLRFDVRLLLPAAQPDTPLVLNTLTTDLPLFDHHLDALGNTVFFDRLQLETQNTPIRVDSVTGNSLTLHTKNAAIQGAFSVSTSLEIETANAPIVAQATLLNSASPDDGDAPPTRLSLLSKNGNIDGTVSLVSNDSSGTGGLFAITARTANAPLALALTDAPRGARISATAHTSNGAARVALPEAFEGAFTLASSMFFRPVVEGADAAAILGGAKGEGGGARRRVVVETVDRSTVKGSVAWKDGGEEHGMVEVKTTNAPLRLVLV